MKEISSLTDQELAAKIRESDNAAYKALYYRYFDRLYKFIWFRLRAGEISLDLTQELFTRIWKNRATLDPTKSIKAYLYRIANNLVINHLQKNTVEMNYRDHLSRQNKVHRTNDTFDLREEIQKAIDSLPDKSRTVFILHRFEEFTYAEIAVSLNVSIKTVEKRMSLALKQLRKDLAPHMED